MWFLTLFMACRPIILDPPKWQKRGYHLELQSRFTPADSPVLGAQLHRLIPASDMKSEWNLSLSSVQRLRDDSLTARLTIDSAVSHEKAAGVQKNLVEDLAGKWIKIRIFEHAELLDYQLAEHWSGTDRLGDAHDFILALIFPNPPRIMEGESQPHILRWPLRFVPKQRGQQVVSVDWKIVKQQQNTVTLAYEGLWTTKGTWQNLPFDGKGKVAGKVRMPLTGGLVEMHQFKWSRVFCYRGGFDICQHQIFNGQLEQR